MKIVRYLVFSLLTLSFALGNLYKFSFFSPDVRISLLDISVFLTVNLVLVARFDQVKIYYQKYLPVFKPLSFFGLIAFCALLLSIPRFGLTAFIVGGMYLARFLYLSFLFISLKIIFKKSDLNHLLVSLGLIALVSCIGQYLLFPDVRHLQVSEWDPHYYRVVGTLLDPGFMGEILLLALIYFIMQGRLKDIRGKLIIIFTYLGFALTYSRSSFLGAYLAVIYYSFIKKSWKVLIVGVLILTLTLWLLPRGPGGEGVKLERTSSIEARIKNWKNTLVVIEKNPAIGVGFNTYRYAQREYGLLDDSVWLKSHAGAGADSSLLFVAATTGLFGLFFYIRYLKSFWVSDLTVRLSLLSLLVHSFFLNSLFYPFILVWLAVLFASNFKDYTSR
jgi:hypothetical protein